MSKNFNWKKSNLGEYDYSSSESKKTYYKNYFNQKTQKLNNFYNKKPQKYKNYKKSDILNENEYSQQYNELDKYESFYPKNYKKSQKQYNNNYNNDEQYTFSPKKNNDFSNYENSINNNNNYEKNERQENLEKIIKNFNDKQANSKNDNISYEEKQKKEESSKKSKKFGIKSIPHPKRKKGSCYISGKKYIPFQEKKDEEIFIKKERKLSNSSMQNNFDSAKHSISTLNTSSSSYKDKDVLNEEKKNINSNEIKTNEFNLNECNNDTNVMKNKFDEIANQNQNNKCQEINPIFENTEILKVNVKLSNNQIVIFKLRRFDDLFLTIKLFCEINSIEEKFIKPIIIKSLCTINTIYQIYNSQVSSENLDILREIKKRIDSRIEENKK